MNKYLKVFLYVIGAIVLLICIVILGFFWSSNNRRKQAKEDAIIFSAICDTILDITEQPSLNVVGFKYNEIDSLQFQILRNGNRIKDTLLINEFTYVSEDSTYFTLNIPYKHFLKTDTIHIKTKRNLSFFISSYHHYAYLHYGMFGYLGSHDCRFSNDAIINNLASNSLVKDQGWRYPEKLKHIKRIGVNDPEYDLLAKNAIVNKAAALAIFRENKENHRNASTIFCRIEIDHNKRYYLFAEEMEDGHLDYVTINMDTGVYKRLKNYPYNTN